MSPKDWERIEALLGGDGLVEFEENDARAGAAEACPRSVEEMERQITAKVRALLAQRRVGNK